MIMPTNLYENPRLFFIVTTIAALLVLITLFLVLSVLRRFWNDRTYRKLDTLRKEYALRIRRMLGPDGSGEDEAWTAIAPGSLSWMALDQVLLDLMDEGRHEDELRGLYCRFGYTAFYENRLGSRRVTTKAAAVDKLGRMRCSSSLPRILPLLNEAEPEILVVTVRALSRIGSTEGLAAVIARLPELLGRSLVTRKAMDTALIQFGDVAIPYLLAYRDERSDPWVLSCVLETLSHLSPDARSTEFAGAFLGHANPEVRSKALKVLGRPGIALPEALADPVLRLLDDPAWFVRIQAIKTAESALRDRAAEPIARLLFDTNWHTRNTAADALTKYGNRALQIIFDALASTDHYAKESICEELENTGFSDILLGNLGSADETVRALSENILRTMHGLHFSTPLLEHLSQGNDGVISGKVRDILQEGIRS